MFLVFLSQLFFLIACGGSDKPVEVDVGPQLKEAAKLLKSNKFPEAAAAYEKVLAAEPQNVEAATGSSYLALLRGDYAQADQFLNNVQESSEKPAVLMRRALIAVQAQEFEKAKKYAELSGMPAGKLIAAEVLMIDDDNEKALDVLKSITSPDYEALAQNYIRLLQSEDMSLNLLAVAQAMWALGDYKVAVRSVVSALGSSKIENKDETTLLWAGRAAAIGEVEQAKELLPAKAKLNLENNEWRVKATKALIRCAEKDDSGISSCKKALDKLEGKAPPQGLIDARVTAAGIIVNSHPKQAQEILGDIKNNGAAKVLLVAGEREAAKEAAEYGVFSNYLEQGG